MKRFLLPIFFVSIIFAKEETSVLLPLKNEPSSNLASSILIIFLDLLISFN